MAKSNHRAGILRMTGIACVLVACLYGFSAHAQDKCDSLNGEEWNRGILSVMELTKQENYDEAWLEARRLAGQCSRSPVLNYLTGRIADERGDKVNALYYYQKASEYTYLFAVDPETAQRIWYARYEAEHPKTDENTVRDLEEELQKVKKENVRLHEDLLQDAKSRPDLVSMNIAMVSLGAENRSLKQDLQFQDEFLMWSGVGIGLAGLALLGTGIGLVVANKDDEIDVRSSWEDPLTRIDASVKPPTVAGWVLIGTGSVMAIGGAILTGIYGYRYTDSLDEDKSVSLHIGPTFTSVEFQF